MSILPDSGPPVSAAGGSEGERAWTPGPWSYYLDPEGYYAISHTSDAHEPGDVAHVYVPGAVDPEYDDGNEGLANARLIASAPALLAAVQAAAAADAHRQHCTEIICPDLAVLIGRQRALTDAALTAAGVEGGAS